ncbi:MAG: 2-dehydropantoate 2-reductase [Firmicutes bacterium]|nr:2-dehydropantoate 2-reductase [Bacillota bacterium]
MKYAILGAGAMGSIIGAVLKKGGQDVILVDPYQEHMEKIKRDGLQLQMIDQNEIVHLATCAKPAETVPVDVVIILVKGFHTVAAVNGARGLFREDTIVCSLQNGIGNEDILKEIFPHTPIMQGVMWMTGTLTEPGRVKANVGGGTAIYLGSVDKTPGAEEAVKNMAAHLRAGGISAELTDNVQKHIWAKAVINACVNGPCGILRMNVKSLFNHPLGMKLVEEITQEVVDVAAHKGIQLNYDSLIADMVASVARAGEHLPSMAQDIRHKRKTEIDFLNGAIAAYGAQLGVPTPANEYVVRFVKIIEESYEFQY